MELTRNTRRTIILKHWIGHRIPGKNLWPEDQPETWNVELTVRTGSLGESHISYSFRAEKDANDFCDAHPVGSEIENSQVTIFTKIPELLGKEREFIDAGFLGRAGHAGDGENPLAFEVLEKAGISGFSGISKDVIHFLGNVRIEELKSIYKENWGVVAAFEFCWKNLPHSSPAYAAAAYQYNHYILEDDFAAGYHWRDLEILVSGAEERALKAERILDAARAGGSARASSSKASRDEIIGEMGRLIAEGKSISNAARITALRGVGTSPDANRKTWTRHKTGT